MFQISIGEWIILLCMGISFLLLLINNKSSKKIVLSLSNLYFIGAFIVELIIYCPIFTAIIKHEFFNEKLPTSVNIFLYILYLGIIIVASIYNLLMKLYKLTYDGKEISFFLKKPTTNYLKILFEDYYWYYIFDNNGKKIIKFNKKDFKNVDLLMKDFYSFQDILCLITKEDNNNVKVVLRNNEYFEIVDSKREINRFMQYYNIPVLLDNSDLSYKINDNKIFIDIPDNNQIKDNNTVPEVWIKKGITTRQEVIDLTNEAFANKENLAYGVYVGKSSKCNICIILDDNDKILNAFPVDVDKNVFLKISNIINEAVLNESNIITIGKSNDIYLCFVQDSNERIIEAFPIDKDQEVYFTSKETLKMGVLTGTNTELYSIAIAIDYVSNFDLFIERKEIATSTSIFKTSFWENKDLGYMVNIDIGNGQIVIGYEFVKDIINEIIKK